MALALLLGATMVAAPHAAAQANHLKVALQGDTSNVDLHLTTHYVSRVALLNVYEMLYTLGEDLSIQPMLADKHTISPDGLTYTITVRKGVKFHNGKVMDAKDVAYTLNRMRNQGCRSAEFKALVKDVEATDASTVRIGLNAPSGVFLANLANVICPVVIYPEGEVEKQGGAITKPVGTGPYEFVEWKKDAFLRVKKFKDYVADSRPSSGLAGKKVAIMETVDFIPIPDSSVRAAAIEKGDVDIAIELNVEDVARMKGKPGLVVVSKPGYRVRRPPFRLQEGALHQPEAPAGRGVRHRQGRDVQGGVTGGQGKPVVAGLPAGMPFHGAIHDQDPYAKPNIQKAKQLMQEAGYKGEKVVLTAHLVPDRIAQGAVVIQAQLQAAGMNVDVKTLESAALQEVWNKGDFELFYSGLTPRPDADVYYCQTNESTSAAPATRTPDYDRLCQEGRKALKAEDRAKIYTQLEQLRRTDLPYYPTNYVPAGRGVAGERQGLESTGARATPACGACPSSRRPTARLGSGAGGGRPDRRESLGTSSTIRPRGHVRAGPSVTTGCHRASDAARAPERHADRGGTMPESIPAPLIIDTLKDTFREARSRAGRRGRRAAGAHPSRLDPQRARHAPEDRAGRARQGGLDPRRHVRDRGRGHRHRRRPLRRRRAGRADDPARRALRVGQHAPRRGDGRPRARSST